MYQLKKLKGFYYWNNDLRRYDYKFGDVDFVDHIYTLPSYEEIAGIEIPYNKICTIYLSMQEASSCTGGFFIYIYPTVTDCRNNNQFSMAISGYSKVFRP